MKMRIKIVPDAEPNADGRWITWNLPAGGRMGSWKAPRGYHTVQVRTPHRRNRPSLHVGGRASSVVLILRANSEAFQAGLDRAAEALAEFGQAVERTMAAQLGLAEELVRGGLDGHLARRRMVDVTPPPPIMPLLGFTPPRSCPTFGACRDMSRCLSISGRCPR